MNNSVIIFGAGYLGRLSKEIFENNGIVVYGFLDENTELKNHMVDDVAVLGNFEQEEFIQLIGKKCEAFIALDNNLIRKNIAQKLHKDTGLKPINAIHKTALISPQATVGYGNFIDGNTLISIGAKIDNHCIINAQSTVGVNTQIADFVQVGTGSTLGHDVTIEEGAFLGSGTTVASGVTIAKGARVGVGSVVIASVAAGETVLGNPAKKIDL